MRYLQPLPEQALPYNEHADSYPAWEHPSGTPGDGNTDEDAPGTAAPRTTDAGNIFEAMLF